MSKNVFCNFIGISFVFGVSKALRGYPSTVKRQDVDRRRRRLSCDDCLLLPQRVVEQQRQSDSEDSKFFQGAPFGASREARRLNRFMVKAIRYRLPSDHTGLPTCLTTASL